MRSAELICFAAGLLSASCPHGVALADTRDSRFSVSVTVPERTDLSILEEPSPVLLSAEDVTRGYKVVNARYRVSSNARAGYLLQFTPRIGLAHTIEIAGLGSSVTVQDDVVEVWRRPIAEAEEVELQLRLLLQPTVLPGRHVLPLYVTAVPL